MTMIKAFFLPTDCKLCYWGRMALLAGAAIVVGTYAGSYWLVAPFAVIAAMSVAAKWLVKNYS